MKPYFLGLIGFALLGGAPLLGQGPPPVQTVPIPAPVIGGPGAPVPGPMIMGCEGPGCAATKTACVPEHYIKKTTKWAYNSNCEPLCLCYTSGRLLGGLFGGKGGDSCEACKEGHCERPYTRKYLVKKKRVCEEDAVKCVPGEAPTCAHGHCVAGAAAPMAADGVSPVMVPRAPSMPTPAPGVVPTPGVPVMPSATGVAPLPNNPTMPRAIIPVPGVPAAGNGPGSIAVNPPIELNPGH